MGDIVSLTDFREGKIQAAKVVPFPMPEQKPADNLAEPPAGKPAGNAPISADGQTFDYAALTRIHLRKMVRSVMREIEANGLPYKSAVLLEFDTTAPGVVLPPHLLAKFPKRMPILFDQWWEGLIVTEDKISVTLNFGDVGERIVVPFNALTRFYDPGCGFSMTLSEPVNPEPAA